MIYEIFLLYTKNIYNKCAVTRAFALEKCPKKQVYKQRF